MRKHHSSPYYRFSGIHDVLPNHGRSTARRPVNPQSLSSRMSSGLVQRPSQPANIPPPVEEDDEEESEVSGTNNVQDRIDLTDINGTETRANDSMDGSDVDIKPTMGGEEPGMGHDPASG
ncbi:hypothetical protein QFC20_005355 [Naganishia adeliensis]|uniref:Uncharacterized protein n=1 Tax=Naganishia adeliensis TaxID=92952 RepID=A0ACC2VP32_9TREE|nr:hypothetical protein QFC20_005355 [Naganishia adeliensis]